MKTKIFEVEINGFLYLRKEIPMDSKIVLKEDGQVILTVEKNKEGK